MTTKMAWLPVLELPMDDAPIALSKTAKGFHQNVVQYLQEKILNNQASPNGVLLVSHGSFYLFFFDTFMEEEGWSFPPGHQGLGCSKGASLFLHFEEGYRDYMLISSRFLERGSDKSGEKVYRSLLKSTVLEIHSEEQTILSVREVEGGESAWVRLANSLPDRDLEGDISHFISHL